MKTTLSTEAQGTEEAPFAFHSRGATELYDKEKSSAGHLIHRISVRAELPLVPDTKQLEGQRFARPLGSE